MGGIFGNHIEVACNGYLGCDLRGATDSLSVKEPLLTIFELEER